MSEARNAAGHLGAEVLRVEVDIHTVEAEDTTLFPKTNGVVASVKELAYNSTVVRNGTRKEQESRHRTLKVQAYGTSAQILKVPMDG